MRCSVFTFFPFLRGRWFGLGYALSDSLQRSVCSIPGLGPSPRCWHIRLTCVWAFVFGFRPRSHAEALVFCLALATANRVDELSALSSIVTFVAGIACLSYIPQLVTKSESLRMLDPHVFLSSLLLGAVLSRLCGWSCYWPPVVPCTGPPLVSASVQVFVSRSPSPFRVPSAPFSRYAYERSVVLFGGGLFCLGGGSTSRWTPPGSRSPQRVHVCRFPPCLVGSLSPCIGP